MNPFLHKRLRYSLIGILAVNFAYSAICGVLWRLGWSHYKSGRGVSVTGPLVKPELEQALHYFDLLGHLAPLDVDAHIAQGNALNHLQRYEEAISRFDYTLRFHPDNLNAHYGKATALRELKRYEEMVEELRRCFEIAPELDRKVRFSEEFSQLRDEPFMSEFRPKMEKATPPVGAKE
ncbi:MAG TPA: hypothetical protein VK961_04180 [Chthoniobacter sp.]|nr:hypothetical protein [Chthoniobacter sp.]